MSKIASNRSIEITPDFFEEILRFFIRKDYQAISLDELHAAMTGQGQERPPTLMTDLEATALEQWLHQHFAITGHVPKPGERLVNRVMMTLHGLYQQLQDQQRALAERQSSGTPVG